MPDVRLIDANALMKRIEEVYCKDCNSHNGVMCRACAHMDDMDFIEDAPTIDAQPVKHGHWIECDSQPNQKMCSSCRGVGVAKDIAQFFTHCPFCGADMRGDKDGR